MDLKSLRYFIATVETGSITAAADACHIAQPSITLAINKLESELETRILERSKKGVTPTQQGRELYQRAKKLVAESQSLVNHFKQTKPLPVLKIQLDMTLSLTRIRELLERLSPLQSRYQLQLLKLDADCSIYITRKETAPANFHFTSVWHDEYCLLLPSSHPLAGKDVLQLKDLAQLPIIERAFCELADIWHQFLTLHNITLNIVAKSDSEEWAWAMVESGIGACIGPAPDEESALNIKAIPLSNITGLTAVSREIGIAVNPLLQW